MKSLFSDKQVEQLITFVETRSGKSGLLRYAGQIYAKHIATLNQGFPQPYTGFQGAHKPILEGNDKILHPPKGQLEEAIQTQLDRKQMNLVVNLSDLTYISSAGINTLGHAVSQYEKVNGRLCYVRPANTAQWHFFTTIGVDQIFPWATSVEEAIKKVVSPAG